MALASMCFVQLGVAASVSVFGQLGAEGTAWLRLCWAGAIVLVAGRPWRVSWRRAVLVNCIALGVVTAAMTLLFMGAVARLPLGTASALEFLGPLAIAITRGRTAGRLWAVLAGIGVLLLTEPWHGGADPVGLLLALCAALCWGLYIMLTQRAGDDVEGLTALAISMPVAALVATVTFGPAAFGQLTWRLLLVGLGLAMLLPVIPYSLELLALRRLSAAGFGTLMCLEPAIASVIGLLILRQVPHLSAGFGILLVVAAGIGAERTGARLDPSPRPSSLPPSRPSGLGSAGRGSVVRGSGRRGSGLAVPPLADHEFLICQRDEDGRAEGHDAPVHDPLVQVGDSVAHLLLGAEEVEILG